MEQWEKCKFGQKFWISKFCSNFSVKNSTPISTENSTENFAVLKFDLKKVGQIAG